MINEQQQQGADQHLQLHMLVFLSYRGYGRDRQTDKNFACNGLSLWLRRHR